MILISLFQASILVFVPTKTYSSHDLFDMIQICENLTVVLLSLAVMWFYFGDVFSTTRLTACWRVVRLRGLKNSHLVSVRVTFCR